MPIRTNCPGCNQAFELHERLANKTLTCKKCGNPFTVPDPSAEPLLAVVEDRLQLAPDPPAPSLAAPTSKVGPAASPRKFSLILGILAAVAAVGFVFLLVCAGGIYWIVGKTSRPASF